MSDAPARWHPSQPDADGDGLDVDTTRTVEGWQITPASWDAVAAWCGGTQVWQPRGVALGSLHPDRIGLLGDYVMRDGDGGGVDAFTVSRADGHHQRWAPIRD